MHVKEPQTVLTFTSIAKLVFVYLKITVIIKLNKSQINTFKQTLKNKKVFKSRV